MHGFSKSSIFEEKQIFLIWVWGFLLVMSQRGHVFEFLTHFNWPWAPIQSANFWISLNGGCFLQSGAYSGDSRIKNVGGTPKNSKMSNQLKTKRIINIKISA